MSTTDPTLKTLDEALDEFARAAAISLEYDARLPDKSEIRAAVGAHVAGHVAASLGPVRQAVRALVDEWAEREDSHELWSRLRSLVHAAPFSPVSAAEAKPECTCGAHPHAEPEWFDHGSACPWATLSAPVQAAEARRPRERDFCTREEECGALDHDLGCPEYDDLPSRVQAATTCPSWCSGGHDPICTPVWGSCVLPAHHDGGHSQTPRTAAEEGGNVCCDSCSKGLHAGCQGHRVKCSCGCGDASDGGRLG